MYSSACLTVMFLTYSTNLWQWDQLGLRLFRNRRPKVRSVELYLSQLKSDTLRSQSRTEPKASMAKNDNGLAEIRKLKPSTFKEGGDLPTFLEKFMAWAKAGQFKTGDLHAVLLAMIDDNPTYHQLKNLTLTSEEKSDAELLVNACNRFLYPEAEVAIMKSAFQNMEQKEGA